MISALFYLQFHSVKNRLKSRVKRLQQPKYLVGAVVGILYLCWALFHLKFVGRIPRSGSTPISPENLALFEVIGALIFFVIVLLSWVIPHERAALTFTEAEVAFLFPAPLSRRGLIHFKLLRSQVAILFTTLFLILVSSNFGGRAWIHAAGWWLVLSTLNLHLIGSSFARTMLLDKGITNWQRRAGILVLLFALIAVVFVWAKNTLPIEQFPQLAQGEDPRHYGRKLSDYVQHALSSGPMPWLLFPFRLVVRPYLAPNPLAFFVALGPALLIVLLHYVWVIRSNVAFEEASVEASRRIAERVAAIRAGNWQASGKKAKAKRPPFRLAPTGFPAVALLWKNLIHAGQAFTGRIWISLLAMAIVASIILHDSSGPSNTSQVIGFLAMILLLWSLLLGPQVLRQDFRQDVQQMDMLKLLPMPSWQIVLGELLAPTVILTAIQWFLLVVAMGFGPGLGRVAAGPPLIVYAFSAAIVLPMLNLISLLIPNAAVLLFPAWFQMGTEGPRGIEATGQRLISMLGQLVVFALALIPAAIVFTVVLILIKLAIGAAVAMPIASLAAAAVLALEAFFGVKLLGGVFQRFDLSAELTNP
jgi:hypothetical protein